ncbi:MAG: DNRLRE domain-containing protein, partial [Candidatus Thorarchaeota archaeon]
NYHRDKWYPNTGWTWGENSSGDNTRLIYMNNSNLTYYAVGEQYTNDTANWMLPSSTYDSNVALMSNVYGFSKWMDSPTSLTNVSYGRVIYIWGNETTRKYYPFGSFPIPQRYINMQKSPLEFQVLKGNYSNIHAGMYNFTTNSKNELDVIITSTKDHVPPIFIINLTGLNWILLNDVELINNTDYIYGWDSNHYYIAIKRTFNSSNLPAQISINTNATKPQVTINSPNSTVADTTPTINVSANMIVNTFWYNIDNGTNITICNSCSNSEDTYLDLSEGSYFFYAFANSSSGFINDSESSFFTIDMNKNYFDTYEDNSSIKTYNDIAWQNGKVSFSGNESHADGVTFGENTGDDYTGVTEDTGVWSTNPNTNYDSGQDVDGIYITSSDGYGYMWLRFDLSSIPTTAQITGAELNLFSGWPTASGSSTFKVANASDTTPGQNWGESTATYNNYDGSNAWTGGNDGGAADRDSILSSLDIASADADEVYYTWVFNSNGTRYIQSKVGSTAVFTVYAVGDHGRQFRASEQTDNQRPFLNVTYIGLSSGNFTSTFINTTSTITALTPVWNTENTNLRNNITVEIYNGTGWMSATNNSEISGLNFNTLAYRVFFKTNGSNTISLLDMNISWTEAAASSTLNVTLLSPANGSTDSDGDIEFKSKINSSSNSIKNVSLY